MSNLPMAKPPAPLTVRPPRGLLRRLGGLSPRGAILIGLLLLSLIGVLDYVIGADISLAAFYLLPVSLVAWCAGRRWGVAAAATATVVWLFANVSAGLHFSQPAVYVWNSLMGLGPLLLVAYLFSELRLALDNEQQLARTDYVTGALNVRAYYEALQAELARLSRYGHSLAVAYLDLDSFKKVNDDLGHATGDEVLRTVAADACAMLRTTDSVARVGGDEFGLLLPETGPAEARATVEKLRRRLLESMAAHHWPVTFSIGVLICRGGVSADDLIRRADALMYDVKRGGKNGLQLGELQASLPQAKRASTAGAP